VHKLNQSGAQGCKKNKITFGAPHVGARIKDDERSNRFLLKTDRKHKVQVIDDSKMNLFTRVNV
jgi:hypothetical protein